MCIMVVDNDSEALGLLRRGLAYEGYTVETALDGVEALEKMRSKEPDLVVLDAKLPDMDALEVTKQVRLSSDVPILLLTAMSSVADRVAGLDGGADDCLTKPFAFDELLARVRTLLRRHPAKEPESLRLGQIELVMSSRQVKYFDDAIGLSPRERDLLELLLRNANHVLKRERIIEGVWGREFDKESGVLEVYIRYLRAKLEAGEHPRLIHTVRGVGYVLRA